MNGTRRVPAVVALLSVLALAGCTAAPQDDGATAVDGSSDRELRVFAAASLRTAFQAIASAFVDAHPGMALQPIVFDGSSTLVAQLQEGAAADVVATADERSMRMLVDAEIAQEPMTFATNTLVVAVPAGNPGNVHELADLAQAVTVLCAPGVPCGVASTALLDAAGVLAAPASIEQSVTGVLQKVAAGEADAGLVYASDVIGVKAVESFVPVGAESIVNQYPIAALDDAGSVFVDFVLSEAGQRILRDHGFGTR